MQHTFLKRSFNHVIDPLQLCVRSRLQQVTHFDSLQIQIEMSGLFVNMRKSFGFKVIGAMKQLLVLKLLCQPDCSNKLKDMLLAVLLSRGTPGLLELN